MEIAVAPDAMCKLLERKPRSTSKPGGGNRSVDRQGNTEIGILKRARGFAKKHPPAIEGQGGRVVAFHLACALIHGFRLNCNETVDVMLHYWNEKCEPPWSEEELLERATSAQLTGSYTPIPERPARPRAQRVANAPSNNGHSASATTQVLNEVHAPPRAETVPAAAWGRLASEFTMKEVGWFLQPYVPRGMLTLVVGQAGAGKSTFIAHLMRQAKRSILLPGYEESFEAMTLPRIRACGIDPSAVRVLHAGDWTLPTCRERLIRAVRDHGADLVVWDPIGSYLNEAGSENDGQHVRPALECAARIAAETDAACVAVRHPGKDPRNVMVGSREWRAVPRQIVELLLDPGPPAARMIQLHKDSLGQEVLPRAFSLVGDSRKPRRFELGEEVQEADVELAQLVPDRIERSKIDRACELIARLLANGEMLAKTVYQRGEEEKLGDRTMDVAARRLAVVRRREGNGTEHRMFWSLTDTAGLRISEQGGV